MPPPLHRVSVLVPVKAFAEAKVRLAPALTPDARADLARTMATAVVAAAAPLPVSVACDHPEVAAWAESVGAQVVWTPGLGLNGAVECGVARLKADGIGRVVVAHADLPLARDLYWVSRFIGVTVVPDRRDDGTNVVCIPTDAAFRFSYGAGSARRHVAEARRLGLPVRVVRALDLGWDVDVPGDLDYTPIATPA